MKSISFRICLFFAAIWLLQGCQDCVVGVGDPVSEIRQFPLFDAISVEGSIAVELIQKRNVDKPSVQISAQQNLLDLIDIKVEGSILKIGTKGCYSSTQEIKVAVEFEQINELVLSGSGSVWADRSLSFGKLEMLISGSGSVDIEAKADKIDLELDGSGSAKIEGSTDYLVVDKSGSGTLEARNLKSDEVRIVQSGSGMAHILVKNEFVAQNDGSGSILYWGNPKQIEDSNSGSGSILHQGKK